MMEMMIWHVVSAFSDTCAFVSQQRTAQIRQTSLVLPLSTRAFCNLLTSR